MHQKIVNSSTNKGSRLFWYGLVVLVLICATFLITALIIPADFYYDRSQAAAIDSEITEYIGEKVSAGDNLLLLGCYKKDIDSVELTYRKIKDIDHFMSKVKRPVLVAVREQTNRFANPVINPFLEDIAEQFYKKIYVILVEPEQESDFVRNLEFKYVPTFYFWQDGKIKAEISGFKDADLADFKQKVEAELR